MATDRVLVVMGYSGSDDFDISPFLKKVGGISRIVWIDHVVDPKILPQAFRVERDDNSNKEIGQTEKRDLSHVDGLLLDIIKDGVNPGIEIVKIVANTGNFIGEIGWKAVLSNLTPRPQLLTRSATKAPRPPFKEWCKPFYENIDEFQKRILAYILFNQLGVEDAKIRCVEAGLESATRQGNQKYIFAFINYKAIAALVGARLQEANTLFEHALAMAKDAKNSIGIAAVLGSLGEVWHAEGNIDKALELYYAALAATDGVSVQIKERMGRAAGEKITALGDLSAQNQRFILNQSGFDANLRYLTSRNVLQNNIGSLYFARGDLDRALQYFKDALDTDEQLGDMYGKAKSLRNIGRVYMVSKLYSEAIEILSEALQVNEELGETDGIAMLHGDLGDLYYAMGDYYRAIDYYEQALSEHEQRDNKMAVGTIWSSLSDVYRDQYKKNLAQICLTKALSTRTAIHDQVGTGSVFLNESKLHLMWGDYLAALAKAHDAVSLYSTLGNKDGMLESNALSGQIYMRMGSFEQAIQSFEVVLGLATELKKPSVQTEFQAYIAKAQRLRAVPKDPTPPTREACNIHFRRGMDAITVGDAIGAYKEFKDGLTIALAIEDRPAAANLFNLLAQVTARSLRYDDAIDYAIQAIVLYDKLQDFKDMATLLQFTAGVYEKRQELFRAAAYYLRTIEVHEMVGTTLDHLVLYRQVFQIYTDLGQSERAIIPLEAMYTLAKEVHNLEKLGEAISWRASVAVLSGDFAGAVEWFKEGLKVDDEAQNVDGYYGGLLSIGTCYEMLGDLPLALDWYCKAQAYAKDHGLNAGESESLERQIIESQKLVKSQPSPTGVHLEVLLKEGIKQIDPQKPEQAMITLLAGLSIATTQQITMIPQFLYQIGVNTQSNPVLALNYLAGALIQAKKVGNVEIQATSARLSGQILVKDQQWARAVFQFEKAVKHFGHLRQHSDQAECYVSLAKAQGEDTDRARAFYFEAAGASFDLARNYDAAIKAYLEASAVYKKLGKTHNESMSLARAGRAALSGGKLDKASEYLVNALTIEPALGDALYDQARIFARRNIFPTALETLKRAIMTDVRYAYQARKEPDFQSLSHSPEYEILLK